MMRMISHSVSEMRGGDDMDSSITDVMFYELRVQSFGASKIFLGAARMCSETEITLLMHCSHRLE
jgi:hypothetical protein